MNKIIPWVVTGGAVLALAIVIAIYVEVNKQSTPSPIATHENPPLTANTANETASTTITRAEPLPTKAQSTSTRPTIAIVSPKGGETFLQSGTIPISYDLSYQDENASMHVILAGPQPLEVAAIDWSDRMGDDIPHMTGKNKTVLDLSKYHLAPGNYKIGVCDHHQFSGQDSLCGYSSNFFTIK